MASWTAADVYTHFLQQGLPLSTVATYLGQYKVTGQQLLDMDDQWLTRLGMPQHLRQPFKERLNELKAHGTVALHTPERQSPAELPVDLESEAQVEEWPMLASAHYQSLPAASLEIEGETAAISTSQDEVPDNFTLESQDQPSPVDFSPIDPSPDELSPDELNVDQVGAEELSVTPDPSSASLTTTINDRRTSDWFGRSQSGQAVRRRSKYSKAKRQYRMEHGMVDAEDFELTENPDPEEALEDIETHLVGLPAHALSR